MGDRCASSARLSVSSTISVGTCAAHGDQKSGSHAVPRQQRTTATEDSAAYAYQINIAPGRAGKSPKQLQYASAIQVAAVIPQSEGSAFSNSVEQDSCSHSSSSLAIDSSL